MWQKMRVSIVDACIENMHARRLNYARSCSDDDGREGLRSVAGMIVALTGAPAGILRAMTSAMAEITAPKRNVECSARSMAKASGV